MGPHENGAVSVGTATNSDHGIQIIGHAKIGAIHIGAKEDEKVWRSRAVLRWLSPSDEAIKLQQIIHEESRTNHKIETTGQWFLQSSEFVKWLEGGSQVTWVSGGMGCGKTVLFFLAVEEVRKMCKEDSSKNFGYFYCTSRSSLGQNIAILFRSILRHLCRPNEVPMAIQKLYDICDEGLDHRQPTIRELTRILSDIGSHSNSSARPTGTPKDYYLLIDGLDELEESARDAFLGELGLILSANHQNFHILITSRSQKQIGESLQEMASLSLLPVDTKNTQADIRAYVTSEIQSHKPLRKLPPEVHEAIYARVVDQSHGMFRWAFLQMQSLKALKAPVTQGKVQNKLKSLPNDLDETYEKMLNDLDEYDKPRAKRALMWLVFSARQLYIEELIDACAIDMKNDPLVDDKLAASDMETLLRDLILIQPSISTDQDTVEPQTHTAILVHASIREFLIKEKINAEKPSYFAFQEREANISLAQNCLVYLLCYNTYALRASYEEYPLRGYAWYYWDDHIDLAPEYKACVATIPTAMLRRKAKRIFGLITLYIKANGDDFESIPTIQNTDGMDLSTFFAVMYGVKEFADSSTLKLQSLSFALNIPYFHPQYDKFCPMVPASKIGNKQLGFGLVSQLSLNQRVNSFQHRELPDPTRWIRLLEIMPAVDSDTVVRCRLFSTKLSEAPPYAALSYAWGGNFLQEKIIIEGRAFSVIESQLVLLRSMRSRTENFNPAIWLDALCIDQNDIDERVGQVQIMGDIFARAREVVIGLGNGNETDDQSVRTLANLVSETVVFGKPNQTEEAVNSAKRAVLKIDESGGLQDVIRIFQNSWWMRRWMIQEIVLSIKAVALFGSMSFNFDLVEQLMLVEQSIKDVLRESNSPSLADIESCPGWHAAKQITHTRLDYRQNKELTLPNLLWRFWHSITTDSRDRIYSFLGFCGLLNYPDLPNRLKPDYQKPPDEVFLHTAQWILEHYKSLDLLSFASSFEIQHRINCSWNLPFHGQVLERQPLSPGIFAGTDPFQIYSASGVQMNEAIPFEEHGCILNTQGMIFDEIAKVLGSKRPEVWSNAKIAQISDEITAEQMLCIRGNDRSHMSIEAKWRTLLADQWPLGSRLSTCTFQGTKIPPQTEDEEKHLLKVIDIEYDIPQLKGRRVIITAQGRLGLASEGVGPGDKIALMQGGAVPYVLRPNQKDWQFVGEW